MTRAYFNLSIVSFKQSDQFAELHRRFLSFRFRSANHLTRFASGCHYGCVPSHSQLQLLAALPVTRDRRLGNHHTTLALPLRCPVRSAQGLRASGTRVAVTHTFTFPASRFPLHASRSLLPVFLLARRGRVQHRPTPNQCVHASMPKRPNDHATMRPTDYPTNRPRDQATIRPTDHPTIQPTFAMQSLKCYNQT